VRLPPRVHPASPHSADRNRFYRSNRPPRSPPFLARQPHPTSILAGRRLPFTQTLPHLHYSILMPLPPPSSPMHLPRPRRSTQGKRLDAHPPRAICRHRPSPPLRPCSPPPPPSPTLSAAPVCHRCPRLLLPPPLQRRLTRHESPPDAVSGSTPPPNRRHLRIHVDAVAAPPHLSSPDRRRR
jgi:hypothetical protein